MMAQPRQTDSLLDRLPTVRGRYREDVPLSGMTWFRVGGPAEIVFRPADQDDLVSFLTQISTMVPVTTLGVGSNVLVSESGLPGVVIRLGGKFAQVSIEGDRVRAGAGALSINTSLAAAEAGLGGLEFLRGIPGTIGGGLRMNAGSFGSEFKDVLVEATALERTGTVHTLSVADMGFGYRHCSIPEDWIFVSALLQGESTSQQVIAAKLAEINRAREESQPVRVRTGGSTFKNPPGLKAWELIDAAGCRGLRIGGAQVSEKHCNFLINTGDATAADIKELGEEVRRRVKENSGVELEWEIRHLGSDADKLNGEIES